MSPGVAQPPRTGAELYQAACASCHGPDGKGQPRSVVGFDLELPDFSDCRLSTPEPDADWSTVIHIGGPVRAFDRQMPAFIDALSDEEIDRIVDHLRGFCTEPGWPRGDLNLPRPLVTEKAFPENEAVMTTTIGTGDLGSVVNKFVYEHRLGRRGQYEIAVPFALQQRAAGGWNRGLGDIGVGYKHVLFDSLARGAIVSAGSELTFPTGKELEGLGSRLTIFEPFAAFSQMLPRDGFLHVHAGMEMPINVGTASNEVFWRAAAGKTFSQARWGRAWSPMVELLGTRELADGERNQWDVVPEMQVTLSTRQHIMLNVGVRVPLTDRVVRRHSVMVYFLWDWFDGGLFAGW